MNISRILLGLLLIVGAGSALVGGTSAFFSDVESSLGNYFTAGEIDLLVDNDSYYNGNRCTNIGTEESPNFVWQGDAEYPEAGTPCDTSWLLDNLNDGLTTIHKFFNFNDLKPSDEGEDTISLHVQNDAWMCMDVSLTTNDDNTCNEPESIDDPTCAEPDSDEWDGELAEQIQMVWWADDGDNVLEVGEPILSDGVETLYALATTTPFSVALADSQNNAWGLPDGTPVPANQTAYVAKAWCLGTLSLEALPDDADTGPQVRGGGYACDGDALDNSAQTDQVTLDVSFRAIQARNNESFLCDIPEEPPTFGACEVPTLAFADTVVSSNQGVRKNNTAVLVDRSDPSDALGAPQSTGTPFDNPVVAGSFFSLGFDEGTDGTPAEGGWIIVEFADNVIVDGPGNDLRVWEVTGGTSYPVEKVKIEVSQDGSTWVEIPPSLDRDAEADLAGSGLTWAKYVRLTDVSVRASFEDTADGYDLDAFSALNCGVPEEEAEEVVDQCPNIGGIQQIVPDGMTIVDGQCVQIVDEPVGPVTLVDDGFGTGTCLQDIPGWDEDPGESCTNGTVAAAIDTGDDTASPDGGRFALIGNLGYICKQINATGLQDLELNYYWRGDSAADAGDTGGVHYFTGGTCASPTGQVNLTSHDLTSTSWSALQSVNLPNSLNNTSFFIRFTSDTNSGTESFRVDGVSVTGTSI